MKNCTASSSEQSWDIHYKPEVPPLILSDNFLGWQVEVLRAMNHCSVIEPAGDERRLIHIVHDYYGHSGQTTFFTALNYEQPNRFLIVQGIPSVSSLVLSVMQARRRGWNGDSIVCDLTSSIREPAIDYQAIELLMDAYHFSTCRNVWIFTSRMLNLAKIPNGCWKVFRLSRDNGHAVPSSLIVITPSEVGRIFHRENK